MKLILIKEVDSLGKRGDIVDVADGYARNFLLPRSLAVKATPGALEQAESMRQARIETEQRALEAAQQLSQSLVGSRVVVAARSGDEGKLFGSIGAGDIAEAIKKFTGHEVDRKIVVVPSPIREIGLHEVTLRPHTEVEFQVTLDVIPA
ncbi:MAG: 50S ribosomal protein L9 [Acidimicrobiia bacterium]|nr:50S ribosomal protein L9 [Acidimicrobiia bacterium]NNC75823.1 50S ribosomal protein L9 [Acidimicrobiia bacterium]